MRIGNNLRELILHETAGKEAGELKAIKNYLEQITGLPRRTIERISDGYRPRNRALRRDAGIRKIEVTDDEIYRLETLMMKFPHLTYARAVAIGEMNEVVRPGVVTGAMLGKIFFERGIGRRRRTIDVAPARQWEGRWPNDIWEFDTTKLEHLHLDVETMRVSYNPRLNYKNSRGERAVAIWLYLFVDSFSRVEIPCLMVGLHHFNHIEALRRACTEKARPTEFPAFGLPKHIRQDKGGGNQALKWHATLVKLDIHEIPAPPASASPFGSRSRGKVENPMRFYNRWEEDFQLRDSMTWQEAEEFLYQTSLQRNNRLHSVTRETPFCRWLRVEKPRHAPDAAEFKLLAFDTWERKINRYSQFELDGKSYWAVEAERNKKAWVNLVDEWVQVYAEREQRDELYVAHHSFKEPIKCVPVGDVVRPAFHFDDREPTNVEEARERAKMTGTYGDMRLWQTDTAAPAYLPRQGTPFDNSKIRLEPPAVSTPESSATETMPARRNRDPGPLLISCIAAVHLLKAEKFFGEGSLTPEEIEWRDKLMKEYGVTKKDGEMRIDEDEVIAAMKKARTDRAAETGEEIDKDRPFFRSTEE
jgi:hypothetical protein